MAILKILPFLALMMLPSCSLIPESDLAPPAPLTSVSPAAKEQTSAALSSRPNDETKRFSQPPLTNPGKATTTAVESAALFPANEAASISLSMDGLAIPVFINEVFANELKLDFQIAPDVSSKEDLVTLRITEPRNRQEIFELGTQILASYGVIIVKQGDLMRFVLGGGKNGPFEAPLIITGNALPSVPLTHRPIFLVRSLNVISSAEAINMLQTVFQGQQLKSEPDSKRNAVTLNGTPDVVQSAAEFLTMIDRPSMKGRNTLRIDPLYTDVDTLFKALQSVLSAQGYDVGGAGSNITLLPIKELNALFAFTPNAEALALVQQWVVQLDKLPARSNYKDGFYWYQVRNTGAAELASTLNAAMGGSGGASTAQTAKTPDTAGSASVRTGAPKSPAPQQSRASNAVAGAFVVDSARNVLLFRGESDRWQEILPLIRELDQPAAQVLVEVIVAEVSLSDEFKFGVEWALPKILGKESDSLKAVYGDDGAVGSGIGGTGMTWTSLGSSGATKLALNAFASNNNISVLQTPKILVRSGQSATVSVGQQIPLLVSQTVSGEQTSGTSGSRQSVEYKNTGISLTVTPTVFSDGRIDMDIEQEVSNAEGDQSKVNLTPIVSNRTISTSLSLRDGGSVLLGGLISRSQTKGNTRVPLLGSIPLLGHLFRKDGTSAGTTELMVLVVPYLVKEPAQAEALTRSFRDQLHIPKGITEQNAPLKSE